MQICICSKFDFAQGQFESSIILLIYIFILEETTVGIMNEALLIKFLESRASKYLLDLPEKSRRECEKTACGKLMSVSSEP